MSGISEFTQSFFDASSKAWKKNKVKYGQAMYTYKKNAFKEDPLPEPVIPPSVQRKNEREIARRQMVVDEAPLPVRKSPRLREQHLRETYSRTCE